MTICKGRCVISSMTYSLTRIEDEDEMNIMQIGRMTSYGVEIKEKDSVCKRKQKIPFFLLKNKDKVWTNLKTCPILDMIGI